MAKERVERDEEDLVRLYLTDIGQYPLLTKDDEVRLAQTIEAGRVVASQMVKGGGKLYIRIFPQKSVTAIPAETRMGKGTGEIEYWAAVGKPGTILYEVSGLSEEVARETFARVAHKMPVTCRFVTRRPTI